MPNANNPQYPVIVVCNISETFYPFLNRTPEDDERQRLILSEQYRGDRSLMWLGEAKLVFVSHPIPHAQDFCTQFGYTGTNYLAPRDPSPRLCSDMLSESWLIEALVAYAGPLRTVQLIPYATTTHFYRLVDSLQNDYQLTVITPESPPLDRFWVRDYIDSKLGFHVLASQWLDHSGTQLPQRFICQEFGAAAAAVQWFIDQNLACLIKADDGENGIGNYLITPGLFSSVVEIENYINARSLLAGHEVIVEEFIHSSDLLSPSLEIFVPPLRDGKPRITYLSRQIFQGLGDFCGVLIDRQLLAAPWYAKLAEGGLIIATELQKMGYIGHFDLDAIVDDFDRPYLLEINPRRTGGTHVHEFGQHYFGPNYLEDVVLLSNDSMPCHGINSYQNLRTALRDFLYPHYLGGYGLIITVTSSLVAEEFGCVIAAPSMEEALNLQNKVGASLSG